MSELRPLTSFVLLLGCMPAYAVWDYSLAAKLAMYDGIASVCRPFVPDLVQRQVDQFERTLSPEERKEMPATRTSVEYREVLVEALKEVRERVAAKPGREREACNEILSQ